MHRFTIEAMQLDPHAIHVYMDGSCYRNPGGVSGCAAIAHYPDHMLREDEQILDYGCTESTNNRMELLACIQVLRGIREKAPWRGVSRIQVITDSLYVTQNIARSRAWKKNGWRNQHNEPKENWDLWKQFISAQHRVGVRVSFEWTAGKKSPILKQIDRAAKAAAKRGTDIDRGYRTGQVGRSMVQEPATRFAASGQVAVVRIYRKSVMSGGENKVRFDLMAEDLRSYTKSCTADQHPASMSVHSHLGSPDGCAMRLLRPRCPHSFIPRNIDFPDVPFVRHVQGFFESDLLRDRIGGRNFRLDIAWTLQNPSSR